MSNAGWRHIPAETIEEVITLHLGHYPPSREELEEVLARHYFTVCYGAQEEVGDAVTYHHKHIVTIPYAKAERMLAMLLHETAEVLLRLPVAPEFHYPLSGENENHNVATVTVERLQKHLADKRERLIVEEMAAEATLEAARQIWSQLGEEVEAYGRAMRHACELKGLRMPAESELDSARKNLSSATKRLKQIQTQLRAITS